MATAARELSASAAFIERNFNLSRRYWGWELAFLVYALLGVAKLALVHALIIAGPVAFFLYPVKLIRYG